MNEVMWAQIRAEDVSHHVLVRTLGARGLSSSYEGLNPPQSAEDPVRREGCLLAQGGALQA